MRKYLKEYKKSVKNTFGKSWETAEKELGPWHGGAVWLTSDRWTAVWGGQGSEMRNGDEGALYLFYWSLMTSWRSRWRLRQKEHFHVYGSDCGTTNVKLFTKMPWVLSFRNWKQLKCVFSFHNSSLQKLKNWVMETELWKQSDGDAKQTLSYGSHHFWVMSYGNWVMSCGNWQTKQALRI